VSRAVLIHGGTPARRASLAQALRTANGLEVRVRVSSRAAEAAKCLADPAVAAVFLVDEPVDGAAVRSAATARGLAAHTYDLEPRDEAEVIVSLARAACRTE
jgi:hypothetical protein